MDKVNFSFLVFPGSFRISGICKEHSLNWNSLSSFKHSYKIIGIEQISKSEKNRILMIRCMILEMHLLLFIIKVD